MNENFTSGSKAQFKKNCIERKVPRNTRFLQLKPHAFKGGLFLPTASCLLLAASFVVYPLGVL